MDDIPSTNTHISKILPARNRKDVEWKLFPSVRWVLFIFRLFYAWPPQGMDRAAAFRYRLKGIIFRILFIYLSVVAQAVYIFTVENPAELTEGLFVLSTQLVLILKIEFFYKNVSKIQSLFYQLDDEQYAPCNAEEDVTLANARRKTSIGCALYLMFSDGLVTWWLFFCFFLKLLLVPSWYPYDYESSYTVFVLTVIFQGVCLYLNASFNISWDTVVYVMLAVANAQLQRLQIQLSKVGHRNSPGPNEGIVDKHQIISVRPAENRPWKGNILPSVQVDKQSPEEVYYDLLKCVIFHQKLVKFLHELLELFGGIIVIQLYCSVFIICITEFHLLTDFDTLGDLIRATPYLFCILLQVYQYCFYGNEISYTSQNVHQATAFVNYPDMDLKTRKLLILFQQRTSAGVNCYAKNVFKIDLSNATFVSIMKSSYSFLAVLRSMMD